MSNVTFYPDEFSVVDARDDEDVEYLVVSKKDWDEGIVFGFSTRYYSIAQIYVREHSDQEWVITCV